MATVFLKDITSENWQSDITADLVVYDSEATETNGIRRVKMPQFVTYDSIGNIELPRGCKVLATHPDTTQHELIGLNEYTLNDQQFLQSEIGDPAAHTNFNTNYDTIAGIGNHMSVDTRDSGGVRVKKLIAYVDDLPYNVPISFMTVVGSEVPNVTWEEIRTSYDAYIEGRRFFPAYATTFKISTFSINSGAAILQYYFQDILEGGAIVVYFVQISATAAGVTTNVTTYQ